MKTLKEYFKENIVERYINEEDEIKNEEEFREYAKNKFKEAFGDDLDKNKMKKTIDGLLKDNKKLVDDGEWGKLVGMLNNSFGS